MVLFLRRQCSSQFLSYKYTLFQYNSPFPTCTTIRRAQRILWIRSIRDYTTKNVRQSSKIDFYTFLHKSGTGCQGRTGMKIGTQIPSLHLNKALEYLVQLVVLLWFPMVSRGIWWGLLAVQYFVMCTCRELARERERTEDRGLPVYLLHSKNGHSRGLTGNHV